MKPHGRDDIFLRRLRRLVRRRRRVRVLRGFSVLRGFRVSLGSGGAPDGLFSPRRRLRRTLPQERIEHPLPSRGARGRRRRPVRLGRRWDSRGNRPDAPPRRRVRGSRRRLARRGIRRGGGIRRETIEPGERRPVASRRPAERGVGARGSSTRRRLAPRRGEETRDSRRGVGVRARSFRVSSRCQTRPRAWNPSRSRGGVP